jgi:hypothetical protein
MTKKRELERSWNKLSKLANEHMKESLAFHRLCEVVYGTNWNILPSLQDHDPIIDTIDYGIDSLSFEEFDELITKAIKHDQHNERKIIW